MKPFLIIIYLFLFVKTLNINSQELKNDSPLVFINPMLLTQIPYNFKLNIEDTTNIIVKQDGVSFLNKNENGMYRLYFNSEFSKIEVLKKHEDSLIKIKEFILASKEIPITPFLWNNKGGVFVCSGGIISKEKLNGSYLKAEVLNFDVHFSYKVMSFSIDYILNDSLITEKNEGEILNESIISNLQKVKNNYPIVIKDILIKTGIGHLKPLKPLIIYIKE